MSEPDPHVNETSLGEPANPTKQASNAALSYAMGGCMTITWYLGLIVGVCSLG
jgi:hypothetical protein